MRLELFRALRSGLRPHTRSGGYAADSIGRCAWMQTAMPNFSAALGLCSLAAIGGCAGLLPHDPGPGFEQLETLAATGVVAVDDLYPTRSGRWSYEVTAGDDAGEEVVIRRVNTVGFATSWVDAPGESRGEFWRLDDDGNVTLEAVVSYARETVSLFDPPLIVAYAGLAPATPRRHEVAMEVVDLNNPALRKTSGTATMTIEYVDDRRLKTPLGELVAKRVVLSFKADLSLADVTRTTTTYVVAGLGPIVIESQEDQVMLKVVRIRKRRTLVLRKVTE